MTTSFNFKHRPLARSVVALAAMAALWHSSTACVALGQFNFGRGESNAAKPQPPSGRYLPRLFGQGESENAGRPDPFQTPERGASLDALTGDAKTTATSYLVRGKASLAQGDLAGAESWYRKAAAAGASFGPDEYSPDKLADELVRAGINPERLAQTGTPAPAFGDGMEPRRENIPQLSRSADDPRFAGRPLMSPADAARSEVVPAAFAAETTPRSRFSQGEAQTGNLPPRASDPLAVDPQAKSQHDGLLCEARRALAAGDVRAAGDRMQRARDMRLSVSPLGDSPQKVAKLLDRHIQLTEAGAPRSMQSPQLKRDYAEFLMEQADGLVEHNDLNSAEQLARRALDVQAEYGSFQRTPAQLIAQISAMRRDQGGARPQENWPAPQRLVADGPPGQNSRQPELTRLPTAQGQRPQGNVGGSNSGNDAGRKNEAVALVAQSRAALARGDLDRAERLAQSAANLNVPDEAFGPQDERPWMVQIDVQRARKRQGSPVQQAGGELPDQRGLSRFAVQPSVYNPSQDPSRNVGASAQQPTPATGQQLGGGEGDRLFNEGLQALQDRQIPEAVDLFRKAWKHEAELDPLTRNRLRTYLQELAGNTAPKNVPSEPLTEEEARQHVLTEQLFSDVGRSLRQTEKDREADPKGSMEKLKQLREQVAKSEVNAQIRDQQVERVDRAIKALEQYIEENRAQIEQDERNAETLADIDNSRAVRIEVGQKLQQIVDQFNTAIDEHQFAEAEALARQARELDPENPVVVNLMWKSDFIRRYHSGLAIREASEDGVVGALQSADESAVPFDDRDPIRFPDIRYWQELSDSRKRHSGDRARRMTEADVQIYNALKTKVDVRFEDRPLSEVIHTLAAAAGINVHLDRQGLAAEGITSDTPVTINLTEPISLRSALNHILNELRLSYVVQDEVLKITSEQMRESDVYRQVYNVADLVIPIPNFTPSYNMGLAAALRQAHSDLGVGWVGGKVNEVPLQVASNDGGAINPLTMAQMNPGGGGRTQQPIGFGPGGVSGGTQPDFDSLIDLLTATVAPTTWDEVGGPGGVMGFETNLSLVISQTQEVHDEIVDLLEQLRRLQDLQVTIEVRFITLSDNFFERIGVDFDFDINDNLTADDLPSNDGGPSVTIGLDPTGQPTADLDVSFQQNSFNNSIPAFGGFDAASSAAGVGFAILGEIEAFFLIQAVQGDQRTNVMQAPKVTLFNGQQAFVSDTSQTPFVTSVIPVVGDFAAAHQPVIVVLTEGTSLSVQAVVSNDRRFVRLTIVPFFSKIGEVKEFTFNGKKTSRRSQTSVDPDAEDGGEESDDKEDIIEGTTVQLPTFSFVTVTTTVSVPDGGTVLLGGVKRLSEGRVEEGVPIMNKLPYINRLFKNVGIGRETSSLMMMVTPRIIIQEEEEEKLGIGGFGTGSP